MPALPATTQTVDDTSHTWEVILYQPRVELTDDGALTLDGYDEQSVVVIAKGLTERSARDLAEHLKRVEREARATTLRATWYSYRARPISPISSTPSA